MGPVLAPGNWLSGIPWRPRYSRNPTINALPLLQQEEAGIEVFKVRRPDQVWSGCGYCKVPLCKTSNCFQDRHSQKGQEIEYSMLSPPEEAIFASKEDLI